MPLRRPLPRRRRRPRSGLRDRGARPPLGHAGHGLPRLHGRRHPARADRREGEDHEEDRDPAHDPLGGCRERRAGIPRDRDDRAVLVSRTGQQLRLRAGTVGCRRHGDHDARQDTAP